MAAGAHQTVRLSKNVYLCGAALVFGASAGWLMRPGHSPADPNPPASHAARLNGAPVSNEAPKLWKKAFEASTAGRLDELLTSLAQMGSGAEELFKPWIRQAVRVALTDGHLKPMDAYVGLTMKGSLGTVSIGLEVIGELRSDQAPLFMQTLEGSRATSQLCSEN